MIAVLIPFLLAANVSNNETWKYGPEATYLVRMNSTTMSSDNQDPILRLQVNSKMICQTKNNSVLSCRFGLSNSSVSFGDSASLVGQVHRESDYQFAERQFELSFDQDGLKKILVNGDMSPYELDIIRVIVDQMNAGVNLTNKTGSFGAAENFSNGNCETNFKLEFRNNSLQEFKRPYMLETAWAKGNYSSIELQKLRNIEKCSQKVSYVFGNREGKPSNAGFTFDLKASDSRMIFSKYDFISSTSNVIGVTSKMDSKIKTIYEDVSMRLESVAAAKSEAPMVKNGEAAGILTYTSLESSSEES